MTISHVSHGGTVDWIISYAMANHNQERGEMVDLLGYHECNSVVIYNCNERYRTLATHKPGVDIISHPIVSDLGDLDMLPIEMLNVVLQYSDLHTLSLLSLINRKAKAIVEGFIPYKLIKTHAPHVLVVLTSTEVASHFTAVQVADALCSSSCAICGNFGLFLWVPDCVRCCFPCMRCSPKLMPMTKRDAKAAFGLSEKALSKVPIIHSLPGNYYSYHHLSGEYKRRRWLLSQVTAHKIAVEVHGGEEGLTSYINSTTSRAKAAYDQRVAMENGSSFVYLDAKTRDNVSRSMVTTYLPYFDTKSRSVTKTALFCQGCQVAFSNVSDEVDDTMDVDFLLDMRDRTYTEDILLDHFKTCTKAQCMWDERHINDDWMLDKYHLVHD